MIAHPVPIFKAFFGTGYPDVGTGFPDSGTHYLGFMRV
jgi:hypothetical protein